MNSTINPFKEFIANLTDTEFEQYCFEIIQKYAEEENLENFHIEHNKKIQTYDGTYQIDIYVEFMVVNVQIRMLIECKKYVRPVGRDKIEVLANRLQSVGAQKGILISTSGFQSGATRYAKEHGIALWQIMDGDVKYIQNSCRAYADEEIAGLFKWRSCLPKIVVYEYDDYDYPMYKIFPTKSMVEEEKEKYMRKINKNLKIPPISGE